jgi:hypothetical protein
MARVSIERGYPLEDVAETPRRSARAPKIYAASWKAGIEIR